MRWCVWAAPGARGSRVVGVVAPLRAVSGPPRGTWGPGRVSTLSARIITLGRMNRLSAVVSVGGPGNAGRVAHASPGGGRVASGAQCGARHARRRARGSSMSPHYHHIVLCESQRRVQCRKRLWTASRWPLGCLIGPVSAGHARRGARAAAPRCSRIITRCRAHDRRDVGGFDGLETLRGQGRRGVG